MRVKVWGARGSIPSPGPETTRFGGNTSCVEVTLSDGTTIVLDAWKRGQDLSVHAWIYALDDGLLRRLGASIANPDEARPAYAAALQALGAKP